MPNSIYRSLSGLGALVLASVVWGQGHIDSVTTTKAGENGATITIVGQNLNRPTSSRSGRNFIWQFNAKMDGANRHFTINSASVDAAKLTWFSRRPSRVRLTAHTNGKSRPSIEQTSDGWKVYFGDAKLAAATTQTVNEFPDTVPSLPTQPRITTVHAATVTTSSNSQTMALANKELSARVTLDFVNTDLVQILKALAMQANINIVTSPDVAGKLTVSLGSVPLGQAMDFITAMSGVRYTRVGDTYVVATPSKFADMVQALAGQVDVSIQTRVVPLYSHQGAQVKAAVLKAVPVATLLGKYDLLLSSEDISVTQQQNVTPATTTDLGGQGAGDKGGTGAAPTKGNNDTNIQSHTVAPKNAEDNYMVIVGTPTRLDEVEMMARAIDTRICGAMGVRVPMSNGIVQKTYEPHGVSADDLVASMKSDKTYNFGEVQMYATPRTSMSRQVVIISGREGAVDNMIGVLNAMDSMADSGPTGFEIVDLKFIRPQLALVDVTDAVPGLRVKLLPAPVDPNRAIQYTETANQGGGTTNTVVPQANGTGGAPPAGGSSSGGGSTSSGGGTSAGGTSAGGGIGIAPIQSVESVTQWSADVQSNSVPMKLLLRGTPQQIADAKALLAMVDTAPKQVALELRVMELTKEDALNIGLNLSLLTGGSLSSLIINQGIGTASNQGGTSTKIGFPGGGSLSAIGALDQIANKNNLIARPSILASDGALTHIFVGDEVRYVESIQTSQNGTTVTTGQVNVGVDFYVTARIGGEGNMTLDLRPTFSILEGFTDVPGGGKLPQTSSRTASTLVNIKSGETIAIGGLITDQDVKNYSGIPFLKDLPLIGRLFGRTQNSKIRKEVVFFITAREVNQGNRGPAANPGHAEKVNTTWPGGGPNGKEKTGGH